MENRADIEQGRGGERDPDSPDNASLTIRGVARLLNMSERWATKNRARIKGWFRPGRAWRFNRETVLAAMLSGQVLEPKAKAVSLGLRRRRR